jgi:hypothetical protein
MNPSHAVGHEEAAGLLFEWITSVLVIFRCESMLVWKTGWEVTQLKSQLMNARTKSFLPANATICRTAVRYVSDLNCATQPGLVGDLNLAQASRAIPLYTVVWGLWFPWHSALRMWCYACTDVVEQPACCPNLYGRPEGGGNKILRNLGCPPIGGCSCNKHSSSWEADSHPPTRYRAWRSITVFTTAHGLNLSRVNQVHSQTSDPIEISLKFYTLSIQYQMRACYVLAHLSLRTFRQECSLSSTWRCSTFSPSRARFIC